MHSSAPGPMTRLSMHVRLHRLAVRIHRDEDGMSYLVSLAASLPVVILMMGSLVEFVSLMEAKNQLQYTSSAVARSISATDIEGANAVQEHAWRAATMACLPYFGSGREVNASAVDSEMLTAAKDYAQAMSCLVPDNVPQEMLLQHYLRAACSVEVQVQPPQDPKNRVYQARVVIHHPLFFSPIGLWFGKSLNGPLKGRFIDLEHTVEVRVDQELPDGLGINYAP